MKDHNQLLIDQNKQYPCNIDKYDDVWIVLYRMWILIDRVNEIQKYKKIQKKKLKYRGYWSSCPNIDLCIIALEILEGVMWWSIWEAIWAPCFEAYTKALKPCSKFSCHQGYSGMIISTDYWGLAQFKKHVNIAQQFYISMKLYTS